MRSYKQGGTQSLAASTATRYKKTTSSHINSPKNSDSWLISPLIRAIIQFHFSPEGLVDEYRVGKHKRCANGSDDQHDFQRFGGR